MTYSKRIGSKEYEMIQFLMKESPDILPKVIQLNIRNVKYEHSGTSIMSLNDDDKDIKKYHEKVVEKIRKLHSLGYLHGDAHGGNILIDEKDNVRLIDFENSYKIDDVNDDIIEYFNNFYSPETKFINVKDIMNYEEIMYTI